MTAVEWFYQRILAKDIKSVFEQALEIEKQQIKDAYDAGYKDGDALLGYEYFDDSESYYEKTYKKNNL